jgi:NADH-quinone oxidoreductase subunit M
MPLLGAAVIGRLRNHDLARLWAVVFCGAAFVGSVGAWQDFYSLHAAVANDPGGLLERWTGREWLVIDELSAPLLPLTALLYLLTTLVTLRTKLRRFSFGRTLLGQAIVLATLASREPWLIIALMAAGTIPTYLELRARRQPTRVFALHMGLFIVLLVVGWAIIDRDAPGETHSLAAVLALLVAVLIRTGIVPFHCWVTDLFEHATFGRALLFMTPMVGAYAAVRLVLPVAPNWLLQSMGLLSLITAVYASGMALVQRDARRFFSYIFLSHSALVLVGLETVSPLGLTGALCLWLSVALALSGFGLTLRALEARRGRLSLANYHGGYEHTPLLAMCFLLTGMASVGFPGTFGFIATELLVDGAVSTYPHVGVAVVVAAALNGVAIVKAYFLLFTGARYSASVPLHVRGREKIAVLTLTALILGGGLLPQPGVASRHHAAEEILKHRETAAAPSASRQSSTSLPEHSVQERDSTSESVENSP